MEGNTVTFADPETVIDLGGVAKGYIADRLADFLRGEGVTSAIIDLGGNLYCLGSRPGGEPFQVGIQYPYEERQTTIGGLPAENLSVVTSGLYERSFTLDGRLYHHILDPDTGWPVENDLLAVSIVSERSVDGDALSTPASCWDWRRGWIWWRTPKGWRRCSSPAIFRVHLSSGWREYSI